MSSNKHLKKYISQIYSKYFFLLQSICTKITSITKYSTPLFLYNTYYFTFKIVPLINGLPTQGSNIFYNLKKMYQQMALVLKTDIFNFIIIYCPDGAKLT